MKKQFNWNILLVVLPALCLILCILPGTVQTEHVTKEGTEIVTSAIVWGAPEGSTLSYCAYLFPLMLAYLIGAGIIYYRNEGDGMGKGIIVLSAAAVFFTVLPLLVNRGMTVFPYLLLPAMLAANGIAAYFITNKKLKSKYEDPIDEILNRGK